MRALHVNFVSGTTTDNPLADVATSFNSAGLANLPTITAADDPVWVVFNPGAVGSPPEICLLTVHGAAAEVATITRGQQDTAATEWAAATTWAAVLTADDLEDLYERAAHAGDIKSGVWAAAPTGWLLLDGSTVVDGETNYPELWDVIPASWQSGSDIVLPDMTESRVLMGGGVLGAEGGANTHTLVEANLPAHTHTFSDTSTSELTTHTHDIDHNHAAFTSAAPNDSTTGGQSVTHTHSFSDTTSSSGAHSHSGEFLSINNGAGGLFDALMTNVANPGTTLTATDTEAAHTHTVSGTTGNASATHTHEHSHTHSIDVPAFTGTSGASASLAHTHDVSGTTSSVGSGTAVDHTPAHLRVNWAIKT